MFKPTTNDSMANTKSMFRSALGRMLPYTPGEQPPPGKFIKLNTNENPYPPPPNVIEAISTAAQGALNRYPDPLATSFRRRAAQVLGLPGPDWILPGNGSDEILTLLVRGFVGEGERLRLAYPSYILYRTLADIQGAGWEQIPFEPGWKLPHAFGQPAPGVRLVLLPNPNSPSGTIVAPEEVREIASRLECPLVVDEAYVDFAKESCLGLVRENERIVVLRTLSKSYALAGIRFGYLVAQPQIVQELIKIKDSYNCDLLSIAAATAAIGSQSWLAETICKIIKTRDALEIGLAKLGFDVTPSHGNFVWCQHPQGRHQELYAYLKENQILVRYMNFPEWGDGLRISVGTDDQNDALLTVLARFR